MVLHLDAVGFRGHFLGKEAVHLSHAHSPILSTWDDVDELLYACEINSGFVKLIGGRPLSEAEFSERIPYYGQVKVTLNRERLYQELKKGATLVLNRLEMRSLRIKRLCNEIAHLSLGQVVANGYLAMTGNSAFGNHWDAHDVFATQLIGRKRWKIYKPTFADTLGHATAVSDTIAMEMAALASDAETMNQFERTVYFKEKLDGGLNLGVLFARNVQELDDLSVHLASPYQELIRRDRLSLHGLRLDDNLLTARIAEGSCSVGELRGSLAQLSGEAFLETIKELLVKGIIHLCR